MKTKPKLSSSRMRDHANLVAEDETPPIKYIQRTVYMDRQTILGNPPRYPPLRDEVVEHIDTLWSVHEPGARDPDEIFRKRMERLLAMAKEITTDARKGRVYVMRIPVPATRSGLFVCRARAWEDRGGTGFGRCIKEELGIKQENFEEIQKETKDEVKREAENGLSRRRIKQENVEGARNEAEGLGEAKQETE